MTTLFTLPTDNSFPLGIAAGPEGNLWFTEVYGNKIGRITTAGVITEFAIPTANSSPRGIAAGPDGDLWFAENYSNLGVGIGRITAAGVITELAIPSPFGHPTAITTGSDGNLWFTEYDGNAIGRVSAIKTFPIPSVGADANGITAGPDGNLWFTEYALLAVSKIGRITTAGVITEFPVPTAGSSPRGITAGPDGNLWFTEWFSSKIGRITPAGVISEFTTPTASNPHGITAGPDGNLWFTETNGGNIGRITTAGAITEFPVNGNPSGITAGPDGNLWFAEFSGGSGKIGRITTAGTVTEFPVPTASDLEEITAGPDGNLWFTGYGAIGRITTAGIVTEFSVSGGYLQGITAGPDGNLWFGGGGRITTAGTVTEFPGAGGPGITTGPDGNVWFAGGEEIGRIMPEQTTLTPGSGPANVETALAAAGFGFAGGATVTIGGLAATNVSVLHPTRLTLATPVLTAGTLNDLKIVEPDGSLSIRLKAWLVDFVDVPASDGFHDYIATIFRDGITAGYGNGYYGRDDRVTRAQMAVLLLKSEHNSAYTPPPCGGIFADVPCPSTPDFPYSDWIEQLSNEGVTAGCGGGLFCPDSSVTRRQMAVFLLKAKDGSSHVPPAATGIFGDMPPADPFAPWIEELYNLGITGGCQASPLLYCPENPSTRGQMAVFLVKTFGLP